MACFADTNVSQGNVAIYARCGGIFDIGLTENLPRNRAVKKFLKSVKIWQSYGHESVAPFFGPPGNAQPNVSPSDCATIGPTACVQQHLSVLWIKPSQIGCHDNVPWEIEKLISDWSPLQP